MSLDLLQRAPGAQRSWRRRAPALVLCAVVAAALSVPAQAQGQSQGQAQVQAPAQAQAQPRAPLSLEQALRLAQDRSRLLPAQESAAAAARQMAHAAEQLPDPTLKAGISNLPIDGADRFSLTRDFMTMRSLGVMQEFPHVEKRQARAARFGREAEVAEAGRTVALAALRRETAMAWLDRHYQQRLHDLLLEQRAETALQVEAAEAAYRGGRGAQADVFAARSAVAQVDERLLLAERQITTATTRLARWVGSDAARALDALPALGAPRLHGSGLGGLGGPDGPDGLDQVLEHHPQVLLLTRQEALARAEADIAHSNKRRSDWSVELMFNQRGPAYSNMVSVNFSIPLQWDTANRQDRELGARLAMAEQMRAQREEVLREVRAEARTWLQQWQGNRERLARYDTSLIPLAGERTRAALAAYRGGGGGSGGTLGAVLEARRMEIDTRAERLRLEMETALLWAQLETLIPAEAQASVAGHPATSREQTR